MRAIVLLHTLPFVVAMVLLAVHIWKGAAPAPGQGLEPAAVLVQQ